MMQKRNAFRPRLIALLATAGLLGLAGAVGAQDRELTAIEKAAGERANAALQAKDYATARTILASAELAKLAQAHVTLYQLYTQGLGGPKDEVAARRELTRAAELGYWRAMMSLGEQLEREGQPASRAEAKSWFRSAANLGVSHAHAHLGRMLFEDGDHAGAFASWSRGASGGDEFARACLGMAYATGSGTSADALLADYQYYKLAGTKPSEGVPCVDMAAKAGSAWARYTAGMWRAEQGSKLYDPAKAVSLLEAASDQQNVQAAAKLAEIFDKGAGVPRDPARAFTHYLRAARGGEKEYFVRLGEMSLAGDGVPRSVADAVTFFSKDEYGDHQYRLGLIYAGAEGWPRDMSKAVEAMRHVSYDKEAQALAWLKQQADAGNAKAQYAYGSRIGYDIPDKDAAGRELTYEQKQAAQEKARRQAMEHLRRAANQNLPEAMLALVSKGEIESDSEKLRLLRAAAEAGHGPAMLELARGHALGWYGLAKDEAAEMAWHERAARTGDRSVLAALGENYLISAALTSNYYSHDPTLLPKIQQLYRKSARYYEAAHRAGYENAAAQLASIYSRTNIPGVGDPQLAFKWRKAAVDSNHRGEDMEALSKMYEEGRGTSPDLLKAWLWARAVSAYGRTPSPRANSLWEKLNPAQQASGNRGLIICEMSGYKACTV